MTTTRSHETWSWRDDVMPFVTMFMIMCMNISLVTIVKAAMIGGMKTIVFIVYNNALGTLILLPIFIIHVFRNSERPPLSFKILSRFFILGLLEICLFQVLVYEGIYCSSPTMASAIANLTPANTFLLAVVFRMEKIDVRSLSSVAKLLGTITAISGAMVFTLYKGPVILQMVANSPDSHNELLLLTQPSNWVLGGLFLVIAGICTSIWNVLHTATAREYPDQFTIVFFFCLFGTIQCIVLSLFLERNLSAWVLHSRIEMIAVVFGALFSIVFRTTALTWCLEKKGPVYVAAFSPLAIVIAVILGVTFLGDSLHLGSAIGAGIIVAGFYSVMWGKVKEKNKLVLVIEEDLVVADERGSSNQNTPLLSSRNESRC